MSNVSGPISGPLLDVATSASVSAMVASALGPYITSASVVTLIAPYITSASAVTLVANFITSASASTLSASLLSPYITSSSVVSKYQTILPIVETTTGSEGGTVSISPTTDIFYLNNAGLTLLNIYLPAAPATNKLVKIAAKSAVVGVSLGGGTVVNGITALLAGGFAEFCFVGGSWVRVG